MMMKNMARAVKLLTTSAEYDIAPALSCLDIQALAPFHRPFRPYIALAPLILPIQLIGRNAMSIDHLTAQRFDKTGLLVVLVNVGGFQPLFAEFPSAVFNWREGCIRELMQFSSATVLALDNMGSQHGHSTHSKCAPPYHCWCRYCRLQFNVVRTTYRSADALRRFY
jgi:hypothetical protein